MAQYSVEAILKATGVNDFVNSMDRADKATRSLGDNSKKVSASVGSILKAVGVTKAVSAGFDMMKNSVGGAVERFDTLNNFPKVMEKMGFSTDQSTKAINRLSEGTDGLPTTLDSIAKVTQRITSMTGDLDGAVETSLALNNAFIASGASTADASRGLEQYVQMLSKGEVDLQSWRTLQETMPYALQETAKAFGFTGKTAQNDFYEALKNGEITMDEFNDKLVELSNETGGFAEVAKEATGGIGTAWSRLQTAVTRNVEKIIRSINDLLAENGLPTFEEMIDGVRKTVDKMFGAVADSLPAIVGMFKNMLNALEPIAPVLKILAAGFVIFIGVLSTVSAIITYVLPFVKGLGAAFAFIFNPITLVIAAISALVGAFIYFYQTNEQVREGVDRVWNAIKGLIVPVIEAVVNGVKTLWGGFKDWWSNNNEQIKESAVESFTTLLDTLTSIVTNLTESLKSIWEGFKAFWQEYGDSILQIGKQAWELYKAFVESYIEGIVITIQTIWESFTAFWEAYGQQIVEIATLYWENLKLAITTIVEVIVGMVIATWTVLTEFWEEHGEYLQEATSRIWNTIKEVVGGVIQAILEVVMFYFEMISEFWEEHGDTIVQLTAMAWGLVVSIITEFVAIIVPILDSFFQFIQTAWDFLVPIVQQVWDFITMTIQVQLEVIGGIIELAMAIINGDWTLAWEIIKETTSNIWNIITEYITQKLFEILMVVGSKLNEVVQSVSDKWTFVKQLTIQIWNEVKQYIHNKVTEVVQSVQTKFQEVVNNTRDKFNNAKQIAVQIWQNIKQEIFNKAVQIVNDVRNKFQEVKQTIQDKMQEAKQAVADKISEMVQAVRDKAGEMVSAGADLIRGLIDGIKSMASDAVSAAKSVVSDAISGAKSLLGIKSPSRVFKEIGAYTSQGLAIGINNDAHKAVTSVHDMATAMTSAFNPNLDYESELSSTIKDASKLPTNFNYNVKNESIVQPVLIKVDADAEWLRAYIDEENAIDSSLQF